MQQQIRELIQKSGFILLPQDWEKLILHDFGLGNFAEEGAAVIDLLRTERLRITLLILLPNQSLPQHKHPAYEKEKGKEETIRVLYGRTNVYVEGVKNNLSLHIPQNKNDYYTAQHEINLGPGQQYTIGSGVNHWFQAGMEGSVNLEFQNRVDETKNIFADPGVVFKSSQ